MNTREREVMDALAEALRDARESVAGDLAHERDAFKGYEGSSNIAQLEADLAAIDSALSDYDALLAEGRVSSEGAEGVAPFAYVYEWDSPLGGVHRSLRSAPWNDLNPDRTIAVYTHPQPAQGEPGKVEVPHEISSRLFAAPPQGEHERRPIADEVVERAAIAAWGQYPTSAPMPEIGSVFRRSIRAALESAHPRGLSAGSDAVAAMKLARSRFYEQNGQVSYEVWCDNYEAVHALESVLATAEQPSCGQDARDVKAAIGDVLNGIVASANEELRAMSQSDLEGRWFFRWDDNSGIEWNLYKFHSMLDLYGEFCRRWEELHNGSCCIVERVRDTYLMPKIRDFAAIAAQQRQGGS